MGRDIRLKRSPIYFFCLVFVFSAVARVCVSLVFHVVYSESTRAEFHVYVSGCVTDMRSPKKLLQTQLYIAVGVATSVVTGHSI